MMSHTRRSNPQEQTLANKAFALLREDILGGWLEPGSRLRLIELQHHYGLGISPLREGLMRLQSEGLVIGVGQRGFTVPPVTLAEFADLVRAREHIETIALTDAVAYGDAEWETEVVAAFHRLSLATIPRDLKDVEAAKSFQALHCGFHQALVAGCGSPWLLRLHAQVLDHTERYRARVLQHLQSRASKRPRHIIGEHRAIMEAVLARNAPRACGLMRDHLRETLRAFRGAWEQQEEKSDARAPHARRQAPRTKKTGNPPAGHAQRKVERLSRD
jgi:DNA-binding GntR family transcriptional regulator